MFHMPKAAAKRFAFIVLGLHIKKRNSSRNLHPRVLFLLSDFAHDPLDGSRLSCKEKTHGLLLLRILQVRMWVLVGDEYPSLR